MRGYTAGRVFTGPAKVGSCAAVRTSIESTKQIAYLSMANRVASCFHVHITHEKKTTLKTIYPHAYACWEKTTMMAGTSWHPKSPYDG